MIVHFYANLRQVVGNRQEEFPAPSGSTLGQLIIEIVKRYPALRAEMLDAHGNLYKHIHIFVNGRDSIILDGSLDTVLAPGDTISIFPPVGGG
jgi:molybdopterin synthase sulfur carrier subunit